MLVALPVALPAAPALAQGTPEEADDANRTADSPGECVRPSMPGGGDPSLEGALAYNDSKQLYEGCLHRTEGNSGGSEGGDTGGGLSGGGIHDAGGNATQPEECAKPDIPNGDRTGEGGGFVELGEAFEDCRAVGVGTVAECLAALDRYAGAYVRKPTVAEVGRTLGVKRPTETGEVYPMAAE